MRHVKASEEHPRVGPAAQPFPCEAAADTLAIVMMVTTPQGELVMSGATRFTDASHADEDEITVMLDRHHVQGPFSHKSLQRCRVDTLVVNIDCGTVVRLALSYVSHLHPVCNKTGVREYRVLSHIVYPRHVPQPSMCIVVKDGDARSGAYLYYVCQDGHRTLHSTLYAFLLDHTA